MGFFARLFSFLGFEASNMGSQTCIAFWFDEPECPKSLIK